MWRAGPLRSDSATGFPGLLAGPTVEILNFWKQNLSHSSPMGINRYCCRNRLLIVSKSVLKQGIDRTGSRPNKTETNVCGILKLQLLHQGQKLNEVIPVVPTSQHWPAPSETGSTMAPKDSLQVHTCLCPQAIIPSFSGLPQCQTTFVILIRSSNLDPSHAQFRAGFKLLWESNATTDLTEDWAQLVVQATRRGWKYRGSLAPSPDTHLRLCGPAPKRPPTGTGLQHGGCWPSGLR